MSKSWILLSLFAFAMVVNAGCGADTGAPTEVAELDELEQYIADNPSASEEGSDSPIDGSD
ncbi:hypothetical protein SH528x_001346 [Novipirellula sp. SH528]|uniref:hypothetical protein n=1 Tax=Novipirellula sp. SH528 TaxID=3454466 RepID=UPI003FA02382